MAGKVITRLELQEGNYNSGLAKAGRSLRQFQQQNMTLDGAMQTSVKSLVKLGAQYASYGAAVAGAMKVAKDAFLSNEAQLDEWGRTVEASKGVYDGFLSALNNGDITGFLNSMSDIINASKEAYNAMDELTTFQAFNQVNAARNKAGYAEALATYKKDPSAENKKTLKEANDKVIKDLTDEAKRSENAYNKAIANLATKRGLYGDAKKQFIDLFENKSYDELLKYKNDYEESWDVRKTGFLGKAKLYKGKMVENVDGIGYWKIGANIGYNAMNHEENTAYNMSRALYQVNDEEIKAIQEMGASAFNLREAAAQQQRQYQRMAGENGTIPKTTLTPTKQSPKQKAEDIVSNALLDYQQSIEKAKMELQSGMATEADVKKATLSAQERLWEAYGKAYNTYADPKYKEAQDVAAKTIVELGGSVKAAVDAEKAAERSAKQLERANEKLAEARTELANAQASGNLKDIYAAQKKVTTTEEEIKRLTTLQVNVEEGKVSLPDVPTDDKTIRVNVEEGKLNLPDVPTDDKTIRLNVEEGVVSLPELQIEDKTILVNAEEGNVNLPKIPEDQTIKIHVVANTENLGAQIAHLKELLSDKQIGSLDFSQTQTNLADANALQNIIQKQMELGIAVDPSVTQRLFDQILNGANISDSTWQSMVNEINEKLKELHLDPIQINFQTGDLEKLNKDGDIAARNFSKAAGAISSVGGALQSIEDPAAKVAGIVAEAIANIAASFAASLKGTFTPWDWIAAATAGTAVMVSTIASIKSATAGSYAEGGFITGGASIGDSVPILANQGEYVMNQNELGAVAGMVESIRDNGGEDANMPYTTGEMIVLGVNNYGKRKGWGELTFSKRG